MVNNDDVIRMTVSHGAIALIQQKQNWAIYMVSNSELKWLLLLSKTLVDVGSLKYIIWPK